MGSTRLIIAESGTVAGQYDYDAWGEVIWQNGQDVRKGFIDKEKDAESGDHNFGVRQYSPADGGRFVSIDKYWEKYRDLSPYQYAANNPLVFTDPTGNVIQFAEGVSEEFKQGYYEAVNYLRQSETASKLIDELENSEEVFIVQEGKIGGSRYESGVLLWNTQDGMYVVDNNWNRIQTYDQDGKPVRAAQTPAMGLLHEMGHAYHDLVEPQEMTKRRNVDLPNYTDAEEKKVIETIENKIVREINKTLGRKQEVERHNHYQESYQTKGPTTTIPAK